MRRARQMPRATRSHDAPDNPVHTKDAKPLGPATPAGTLASAPVPSPKAVEQARKFVASMLQTAGRADLARSVTEGRGDDFPEVIAAAPIFQEQIDLLGRWEQALRTYASADFWDEEMPGGSLASHDRGEMAVNVLSGRLPFYHRD